MNWAWRQQLPSTPKLVLMALADAADDDGNCWPSVATIAEKACVSTRTVQRVIQTLTKLQLLSVQQRYRSNGSCSSNGYRLSLGGGDKLSPAPDTGDTTPRHPCQGDPDTGVIPITTTITVKEPPPPTAATETTLPGGGSVSDLEYPKELLPEERIQAESMIIILKAPLNQQVLDEWSGIIAAGAIRTSRLGCLRSLIERAKEGRFTIERALRVAQARRARHRVAIAHEQAIAKMAAPGPVNQDSALVRRLNDMAGRASRK